MANQWLRLWHDMPNDPKWRTISRVSGRPIPEVISVYLHLLVCASNAMKRGVTQGWSSEDVATALDMETASVELILSAMQGRVMEGDKLTGWEKRQPKREDSSSERVREFRKRNVTQCNAPDKDKDKDKDKKEEPPLPPKGLNPHAWDRWVEYRRQIRRPLKQASIPAAQKALAAFGDDQLAVVEQSISNGYQGLFELRRGSVNQSPEFNPSWKKVLS